MINELELGGLDHGDDCELLVYVDGMDVLRPLDAVGVDPDIVLPQLLVPGLPARVQVAHCGCGDPTCGSVSMQVRGHGSHVIWERWQSSLGFDLPAGFRFDRSSYLAEIERAHATRPWESTERVFARQVDQLIDAQTHAALEWRGMQYLRVAPAGSGAVAVHLRAQVAGARWLIFVLFAANGDAEGVRHLLVRRGPTSWPVVVWWGENAAASFVRPPMAGRRWRMWEPTNG